MKGRGNQQQDDSQRPELDAQTKRDVAALDAGIRAMAARHQAVREQAARKVLEPNLLAEAEAGTDEGERGQEEEVASARRSGKLNSKEK